MTLTYKDAGVDISQIKKSHDKIGEIISQTHNIQKKAKVTHGFGHYAGIVQITNDIFLAIHTDGVGTKVMVANQMKKYDTVGIDCVAMNVNDVICTGATPISFVNYIAANKNDIDIITSIVQGLATGAKKGMVPIVGGETAIMPDLFGGSEFSFDLAGTVVGLLPAKKGAILGDTIRIGDAIIGAYSTGIHSNGYTLARTALDDYSLHDKMGRGIQETIGDALLTPTEIYVKPVLQTLSEVSDTHGLAHITGGSFTKLLRLKKIGFEIDNLPPLPPIMRLIAEQGVSNTEMYSTFNMGIGFCVMAPKDKERTIHDIFKKHHISTSTIGHVTSKTGVFVNSEKIA